VRAESTYDRVGASWLLTGDVPACIVAAGAAVGQRSMESDGLSESVRVEEAVDTTSVRATDLRVRFAAFVRSHRGRARSLAWRLVGGDDAAADDVTQDAFLKAYRALDGFRDEAALDTWFYRILVRQAHSYRRWRTLRDLWTPGSADDHADPSPGAASDPMLRRRIARGLDRLTRRQREAFVLVHLEGFTVRETAELLGKPEGTVKSHLHRALCSLREDLSDLAGPSDLASADLPGTASSTASAGGDRDEPAERRVGIDRRRERS